MRAHPYHMSAHMGTVGVASDACTHPGRTVTWVRVQPRRTWTSSALGGRRQTHVQAARPALDLTREAGQVGTGSPDMHVWPCHEAVGQLTQHTQPPKTDRLTDRARGCYAETQPWNHPSQGGQGLVLWPGQGLSKQAGLPICVPRHVRSASVLETLSPCSSLQLPITLPV